MNKELAFTIQNQKLGNWCWAAITSSIAFYFDKNSIWSQCKIASTLMYKDCCQNLSDSSPCNKGWLLDKALELIGHFSGSKESFLNFAEIKNQIDAGKPIGVRIEWPNGNGHFIIIHGYNSEMPEPFIHLSDPKIGQASIKLPVLINNYNLQRGIWSDTFFIKGVLPIFEFSSLNDSLFLHLKGLNLNIDDAKNETTKEKPTNVFSSHPLYLINYNSLFRRKKPKFTKVGFRIVGSGHLGNLNIYDFSDSQSNSLQQVLHDSTYVTAYKNLISKIHEKYNLGEHANSLRFSQQPETNTLAFWIHYKENKIKDIFILFDVLSTQNNLVELEMPQFTKYIKSLAKKNILHENNKMGDG